MKKYNNHTNKTINYPNHDELSTRRKLSPTPGSGIIYPPPPKGARKTPPGGNITMAHPLYGPKKENQVKIPKPVLNIYGNSEIILITLSKTEPIHNSKAYG